MRLYEYDAVLAECWDPETGEILDQERMDALDLERDEKIDNICSYIKDLTTDAAAVKEEKQKLAARQASLEKKAESLKRYLAACLTPGEKFKSARNQTSWRKSEQLIVDDVNLMILTGQNDLLTFAQPTVNKTAAKDALKAGRIVPGVHLEEVQNLQIK